MRLPASRRPPALAERWLVRCLGKGPAAAAALGDLHEEFAARAKAGSRWAALWYAGEAASLATAFGRERFTAAVREHRAFAHEKRQGDSVMRILLEDLRFAAVALARRPLFAAAVVATLALGIGGNVALFSVVDGVLLRPLPYKDPERLVMVWENDRLRGSDREAVSAPDFHDFVQMSRSFESLVARERLDRTLGAVAEPVRVSSARVGAGYFGLLGVRPLVGRTFLPEEERPGSDRVVVLTEGVWRERFGADPAAVGRRVLLDGEPFTLVGVVPAEARVPGLRDQIFEPLAFGPDHRFRGRHNLRVFARLKPEATLASAQADMSALMKRLEETYPDDNLGRGALVRSLQDEVTGDSRAALLLLFGAVGLLLLMACASVANLVLTRGVGRERELAIRTSLGAGPWRIFRQLLTESLLLACLGGAAGALVAGWLVQVVRAVGPELPRLDQAAVDGRALGFALGASVLSALVFGVLPAVRGARQPTGGAARRRANVSRRPARAPLPRRFRARRRRGAGSGLGPAGAQLLEAPERGPGVRPPRRAAREARAWPGRATSSPRGGPSTTGPRRAPSSRRFAAGSRRTRRCAPSPSPTRARRTPAGPRA